MDEREQFTWGFNERRASVTLALSTCVPLRRCDEQWAGVACDITTGELAGITDVLSHQPPRLLG
jgi:hypothetical protein